ncbi:MAG: acetoin utilization protein [Betaproteobacteria bacterium]|nr:histone deacetylase family protein [Rhodocyclaceae bacterium]MCG3187607.1 Histone deacetylase-like amidohydrolase [Rhodocyclaceae bacterium]
MGDYHPESPERLHAIHDRLIASGLDMYLATYEAPLATEVQLARAHDPAYIRRIMDASPEQGIVHLDPDTALCPYTVMAALRAAGAGILAVDLLMGGRAENAFCLVRPPGHHAERSQAMGFCFFNNIAVAALHALTMHGLRRVAIVDFDVHHGNGTEDIFSSDPRVLMVSTFQHPFYPYSGTDAPTPNMVNVPLAAGANGDDFRGAVQDVWLPALARHRPEMILISAGFDAHIEDDMASLRLREADYVWVTSELKRVAQAHAGGRIVSMLEGGYALPALARSVEAHIRALADL